VRNEVAEQRSVAGPGIVTRFDGGERELHVAETADRDANQALRERLADVHDRYSRLRSDLDDLRRRLATMRVSAVSPDGTVRATVGPRGDLVDLALDRRIYREPDAERLSRTIVATVREAADLSADEVATMLAAYLPPGSGTLRFLRDGDLGSLLGGPR
jgi:DNA-binding protein YbaB